MDDLTKEQADEWQNACLCCGDDPHTCAECYTSNGEYYLYSKDPDPSCTTCECHKPWDINDIPTGGKRLEDGSWYG